MKKTKNFDFKQFKIHGGYSGMPVSTDGVMLGAWIDLYNVSTLLDIGTGTGLLSLMCVQRSQAVAIEAIDIDHHALEAAQHNFVQSPWSSRLTLHRGDALGYPFEGKFDAIICNPPYFNSGEQANNASRATARHTDTLSHQALIARCQQLLKPDGKASLVLPDVEGQQFIQLAQANGLHLSRLCQVRPTEKKAINRLLIELAKQPADTANEAITIHASDGYSAEFIQLTKDFYLKM